MRTSQADLVGSLGQSGFMSTRERFSGDLWRSNIVLAAESKYRMVKDGAVHRFHNSTTEIHAFGSGSRYTPRGFGPNPL